MFNSIQLSLSLSLSRVGRVPIEDVNENKHFHFVTNPNTLAYIYNPFLAGHKIYNFGIQFLGYHYYILILSDPCSVLEKILKEIHQFYTFCPKITSPQGGRVMKFTIS